MRVTFGRYIPTGSVLHKMDPRLKLAMIILLIASVFFPIGYTGYLLLSAIILIMFAISKLSWRMALKLIIPVSIIFIVIFLINIFLMHPSQSDINLINNNLGNIPGIKDFWYNQNNGTGFIGPDFASNINWDSLPDDIKASLKNMVSLGHFVHWKALWLSEKAIYSAVLMGWRIYLMITLTTILTGSTQPLELTLAIEDLLYPLKLIGIPVYILSMIISIALRMIPTLIDEAGRIMKAQSSRGIDIKNGKMKDKAKGLTSLIIPLLVSAFQKAEDLAYAMDARGYNPHAHRTRYVQFKFRWTDLIFFTIGVSVAVLLIVYAFVYPTSQPLMHLPYIDRLVAY